MRYFPVLDFQSVVLLIFLGLAALVLLYVAFGSTAYQRGRDRGKEREEYPEGIRADDNPVPPILIFLYVGFAVWAVAYAIFIGVLGSPF